MSNIEIANNEFNRVKAHVLIVMFYFSLFLKNYIDKDTITLQLFFNVVNVSIGLYLTSYFFFKLESNSLSKILIIVLFVSALIVSLFSKNYRFEDILLVINYFGIGFLFLYVRLSYRFFYLLCYLLFVFFLVNIFNEFDPNEIFNVSRNYISVLLLIAYSLHSLSCFQNDKKPSVIILIIFLILSIWATGRSGIIVFSLLLVFYPFVIKTNKIIKLLIIAFILLLSLYIYNNFYDFLFEFGLGRFEGMELESDRSLMNSNYIINACRTLPELLFGTDLMNIPSIIDVDGNPHNSFIRLHVYYGLIGFICVVSLICFSLYRILVAKNFLYFLLFTVLLIRASVDSVSFHGPLDPFFYFFIFTGIKNVYIIK